VEIDLLMRLVRADQLGRASPSSQARHFVEGDLFLERARRFGVCP
jgi:hypothetical protein